MNCKDCLAVLETESLREMAPDSPVMRHCATCPDCARVATMVREKEYETATVLNSLPPMSNPLTVAEAAVRTSQRRRVGRVVVMLSGVAGAIIIWIVGATMVVPAMYRAGIIDTPSSGTRLVTETIQLSCLSPQQAGDIIRPYIRSPGSIVSIPTSRISAITVSGTPDELAKSRNLILEFEKDPSAACRLPMTIIQKLREEMSGGDDPTGKEPDLGMGKATTPPKK
jgi:type II secretory pathway component GspD/PulD (secretin)